MSDYIKTTILGFTTIIILSSIGFGLYLVQYYQLLEKLVKPLAILAIIPLLLLFCYAIGLITEKVLSIVKNED